MKIEAGKSYRTRGGSRVDIVHILDEPAEGYSAIGLLRHHSDDEKTIENWTLDGKYDVNCQDEQKRLDIVAHLVPRYGHHNGRVFIVGGAEIAKGYTDNFCQKIVDALNAAEG